MHQLDKLYSDMKIDKHEEKLQQPDDRVPVAHLFSIKVMEAEFEHEQAHIPTASAVVISDESGRTLLRTRSVVANESARCEYAKDYRMVTTSQMATITCAFVLQGTKSWMWSAIEGCGS